MNIAALLYTALR